MSPQLSTICKQLRYKQWLGECSYSYSEVYQDYPVLYYRILDTSVLYFNIIANNWKDTKLTRKKRNKEKKKEKKKTYENKTDT